MQITVKKLMLNNYNTFGISNYKLIIEECIRCKCEYNYSSVKKFMYTRNKQQDKKHLWNTCARCWLRIQTSENDVWKNNNRKSQLIAQNKPEQKIKNSKGVSKSWSDERKKKASDLLKKRWSEDEDFKQKGLYNISWTQKKDDRYDKIISKSLGIGGLKGIYNNIRYDSALELAYILYCIDNNLNLIRYNLNGILYNDENNKIRYYIPDFIINNTTIIEIKGFGLFYKKNYNRNLLKINAVKKWCQDNNFEYIIIYSNDLNLKKYYKKARKLHYEIKKENISKI